MTEAEWECGTDPDPMLRFVRGRASDRKLRLFAAACSRRLAAPLPDPRRRRGIDTLEQMAEGAVGLDSCRGVAAGVRHAIPPDDRAPGSPPGDHLHYAALMLYREFCSSSIAARAVHAAASLAGRTGELHEQARLMRCIVGNPFRTVKEPRWVTPTVVPLARAIDEVRDFGRLPVLADALEEAGCDDGVLLAHCRGEGPHARGCWAIDPILGRG
jgi:hypothetical protein